MERPENLVMWRVDRVERIPPDRRAYLFFVGHVRARTQLEAWAAARLWFPTERTIIVRLATYQRPFLPHTIRRPSSGVQFVQLRDDDLRAPNLRKK